MKVSPVAGGPMRGQVQGIAQLLLQRNQILVCSYVLRTANSVS
ncbi:Possible conserved membrane protein [Mycobacterium tuberculosis]|nr:Possible conserved membrane protein [Mycobacterium tuberculosis]